ncbi:hypothetical protein JW868_03165 [Candidatus Woesearchaeota archaeon]|nr:hypothetical protein [Candidatus Woesearchaeota archaeon]
MKEILAILLCLFLISCAVPDESERPIEPQQTLQKKLSDNTLEEIPEEESPVNETTEETLDDTQPLAENHVIIEIPEENETEEEVPEDNQTEQETTESCSETDTGQVCTFETYEQAEAFKTECEEENNRYVCYGYCPPANSHYCDRKYSDALTKCDDNDDCEGYCTVTREFLMEEFGQPVVQQQNCTDCNGNCAPYPLRECDVYNELDDEVVNTHWQVCN